MALTYSTLRKRVNPQVVDPSTGKMREEWQLYFDGLTKRLNGAVGALGTDLAPADAQYLVGAADGILTAERVVTDGTSVTWDLTVAGQAKAKRAALTGDVTASADSNATTIANNAVTTAKVINDAITYAKMQNVSSTNRFLGRITAGAGDPEELTGTQATTLLDAFTSGLKGLVPASGGGTANFLRADGTFAVPLNPGGITTIASGSLPAAATQSFTSIPATYAYLILSVSGISSNTASRLPLVRVSTNNGSSYDGTAANYILNGAVATNASILPFGIAGGAATAWSFSLYIFGYQGGANMYWSGRALDPPAGADGVAAGAYIGSTAAINALQILWNGTGNFDAGTYALYGVS